MDTTNMTARPVRRETYRGIDYGMVQSNIDKATGIRFGVMSQHSIGEAWYESAEADYGKPHCPKCGSEADEPSAFGETFQHGRPDDYTHERHECDDYVCVDCKHFFGSESAFGDEPVGYYYDQDGYKLNSCLNSDVMVLASPYYTYAQYCSPCVPGACNLDSPLVTPPDGVSGGNDFESDWQALRSNRAYCLGHDWFEGGRAPYPVYSVATGELVCP